MVPKFLIDECLSPDLAALARDRGFAESSHVTWLGKAGWKDWELKQFILDGPAIIASPHKIWGPQTNDLALQLRKRGVSQIVLAGMAANLCMESHLRHLLEEGFEVAVVRDATASARVAAGDGYLAALTNYSFLAHAIWLPEEAVSQIRKGA